MSHEVPIVLHSDSFLLLVPLVECLVRSEPKFVCSSRAINAPPFVIFLRLYHKIGKFLLVEYLVPIFIAFFESLVQFLLDVFQVPVHLHKFVILFHGAHSFEPLWTIFDKFSNWEGVQFFCLFCLHILLSKNAKQVPKLLRVSSLKASNHLLTHWIQFDLF